jgi:guanylate kinase
MKAVPQLCFSISATTRQARGDEQHALHYYFISVSDFQQKISEDAFVEWEKVYEGKYYGTLRSELDRMWQKQQIPILDIDVLGAINVQKQYHQQVCGIFIKAPSIDALRSRLIGRNTDPIEAIEERIAKAEFELAQAHHFEHVVTNDDLQTAIQEVIQIVTDFLAQE